jgi:hypothetical protein
MHGWRSGCCIDILFLHSSQNLLCCIDLLRKKAIIITCIFVYMALDYTKKTSALEYLLKYIFDLYDGKNIWQDNFSVAMRVILYVLIL